MSDRKNRDVGKRRARKSRGYRCMCFHCLGHDTSKQAQLLKPDGGRWAARIRELRALPRVVEADVDFPDPLL